MLASRAMTAQEPLRVPSSDLEEGHARKVLYVADDESTQEIVLCRIDGVLYAADSYCPHEGGRLAEGPLMDGVHYHCPLHLYRFDPRDGMPVGVACLPARTFPVTVVDGVALVAVPGHRGVL